MISAWPLVGREHELEIITKALDEETVTGVVLAGPSGVGKTRLADECLRRAAAAGLAAVRVTATKATSQIPFGALAPLLPVADPRDPAGYTLQWAAGALAQLADCKRLVLFVDDGHYLDDQSAGLMLQLAMARAAFVVVTLRSNEAVPDPVVALWKDGLAERVDVGPLGPNEVEDLIVAALGGPVDGAAIRDLWNVSQGHPLLLRELILGALDSGHLVDDRGLWRLNGSLGLTVRLAELVESRMAAVPAEDVAVLELLAIGEPLGLPLLEELHNRESLEALERRGLLEVRASDARCDVRLAHPLYAEFVRSRMPTIRARSVRRTLAAAFEERGARRREDVLRVATWRLDGGGEGSPPLMLAAARAASVAHDLHLAERLARAALDSGGGIEAAEVLASMVDNLGRHQECEDVLAALDLSGASDQQRAMVGMTRARNMFWGLGRHADAVAASLAVEALVEHPDWRAEMAGQRATFDLLAGRPAQALVAVEPILAREGGGRPIAAAAIAAAPALAVLGRTEEAIAVATRGLDAHMTSGGEISMSNPGIHVVAATLALEEAGRLDEAWTAAEGGYRAALDQHITEGQAWFSLMLGRVALFQGRMATAVRWFTEASALYRARAEGGPQRWALAGVLLGRAHLGDTAAARRAAADLDAVPLTPVQMMESDIVRARAWHAAMGGDVTQAVALLWAAADMAAEGGQHSLEASALHDLVRLGDAKLVADRLRVVAGCCDGPIAPPRAAFAAGVAGNDPVLLQDAAIGFEALGAWLYGAEAYAAAAVAYRAGGRARQSTACERSAVELASRCEGAATPAVSLPTGPDPLSRREREVALLAAGGMRSKDIADRLHVSVRTVENHLQRIYTKLGVPSRDELARVLSSHTP